MAWLKKLFHVHHYKQQFIGKKGTAVFVFEKCKCGRERALMLTIWGCHEVDLRWANEIISKKWRQ